MTNTNINPANLAKPPSSWRVPSFHTDHEKILEMREEKDSLKIYFIVLLAMTALSIVAMHLNIGSIAFSSALISLSGTLVLANIIHKIKFSNFLNEALARVNNEKDADPKDKDAAKVDLRSKVGDEMSSINRKLLITSLALVCFSAIGALLLTNTISLSTASWVGLTPTFLAAGFLIIGSAIAFRHGCPRAYTVDDIDR